MLRPDRLKALELDIESVMKKYPELEPVVDKNVPVGLEGFIDIHDLNNVKRGSFQIQVNFPLDYPHGFPSLRELSGLIPKEIDRHIYSNGNCCVTILQKQIIESNRGITIVRYFTDYVVPYLANQIYFQEFGEWANEEYEHGYAGLIQYYKETLNTSDPSIILKSIEAVICNNKIRGYEKCFCQSGVKFKKCHQKGLIELQAIGKEQLILDWQQIKTICEN